MKEYQDVLELLELVEFSFGFPEGSVVGQVHG